VPYTEFQTLWGHPDQDEGPRAFAEKREPRWAKPERSEPERSEPARSEAEGSRR
jgi:hypothetical protein